jgi:hypothetical protein
MISAVDNGFMSTSRNERTPISYMQGEFNVLWELAASDPSDDAYHCGADISMLSQFEHEDEVLFPPNTMLIVRPAPLSADPKAAAAAAAAATADKTKEFSTARTRSIARKELSTHEFDQKSGNAWMRVHVRPCFV